VLSMGISNTATAAMMLPLALGMLDSLEPRDDPATPAFVLLGVAYSASIGGMGTLVGSPPNAIAARAAGIDFAQWLAIGLPMVALLMPLMGLTLWLVLRPRLNRRIDTVADDIPWTPARVLTLGVFALAALGWVFGAAPLKAWGIHSPDTVVALAAAVAVVALGLASWEEISEHTDWGVLLLFGGGLALGQVLDQSGASLAVGRAVADALEGTRPLIVLLAVATFMVLLSEFASNTAAAALMVPVFATVASTMGLQPSTMTVVVALAASMGFALPVATPPNAMVYATGQVHPRQMLRAGMALNAVGILVLIAWALVSLD
ncbi:MAG: SLC13 family permease, partial [Burkholderiaceae bacterium]|nr:SLC13 family permease [Burkholderiaceae bacterium]